MLFRSIAAWRYVNQGTTAAASGIGGQAQLWTKRDNSVNTLALRVDNNQTATFYGQVAIANTTTTTNSTTGALYVAGGVSAGGNIVIAQSARFNDSQTAYRDFYVRGGNDATLIWANTSPTYNQVIVGNSATPVTQVVGAKLQINSSDSMLLPVGTGAQRPGDTQGYGSATAGMLRFNSDLADLEYYTGSSWYSPQTSQITVVTSDEFNGDGTTVEFTLQRSSSTNNVFVAINGILQDPTYAYSVTTNKLTFTEAPAPGDVIDARVVITTSVVSSIASADGYNTVDVSTQPYANITAGTSSATVRLSVDGATGTATFSNDVVINGNLTVKGGSSGNINIGDQTTDKVQLQGTIVYDQTALTAQGTNLKQLDSFSTAAYSTAKYLFQIKDGANIESGEILLAQDTANISLTTYAVIAPAGALGTFSCNIVSGSAKLWYTPTVSTYANIKIQTTYIV